ncbi:glycosyltransferase [Pseudothermotoga sp. U03pept]|uniref:glycosyltransferase n=1 Tax=Pseudothermotoga sp. U03pept TaxID=3447012 RepID=UPI003F047185
MQPLEKYLGAEYTVVKCNISGIAWLLWQISRRITRALENDVAKWYGEHLARCIENSIDVASYDLIHAHGMFTPAAGQVAAILAQKYGKPYVITVHGSDVNSIMSKRPWYLKILESANAVLFVSNALFDKAKSYGYSGRNGVVIPNGYDSNIFRPLDKELIRKELKLCTDKCRYIGFVGGLQYVKRADKLIEIFERIARNADNVRFIVVGDGELRKDIQKEAVQKKLNVSFTGRVPQHVVAKYMNAMDVMILPSRDEGFGCVALEAQACGTCVIGSNNGGIPEAIGFKEYVVEEGEDFEERFTQKVAEVLENGYDKNLLIERVRNYTWQKIVNLEKQIYMQVTGETK